MAPTTQVFTASSTSGRIRFGDRDAVCVFGRSGVIPADRKREGDGATPLGTWPLRRVFYRPDRWRPPQTRLPATPLTPEMGWCDDPHNVLYNELVRLPFPASHEKLWRDDALYDLIVPLGYNDDPVVPGKGSAIFLHVAAPGLTPTEGCVAMRDISLISLLTIAGPGDALKIEP